MAPTSSASAMVLLLAAVCCLGNALVAASNNAYLVPAAGSAAGIAGPLSDSNAIIIGTCRNDDMVLHSETVRLPSKWMQVRHQLVLYPMDGKAGGLISCLQFVPLKTANIGSAIVQSGGPGQRSATIKVKSDRGHSVAWNVLVYGR